MYRLAAVLPASPYAAAYSVNARGHVAVWSGGMAFVWSRPAGLVPLPGLPGSRAFDIDRAGFAAGLSYDGPQTWATLWSPGGTALPIPIPGATASSAGALNDKGVVLCSATVSDQASAWVWDAVNGARALTSFGLPADCYATDINESSQIVGGQPYGLAWRLDLATSTFTSLGALGLYSQANAVNDLGHAVGWTLLGPTYDQVPFIWTPERGMRRLGTLAPDWMFLYRGGASSINDADVVVGSIEVQTSWTHAYVWDDMHGMRDLNALVRPHAPYELTGASHISDTGWIVGSAVDTSAGNAPVVFIVQPE